jgi:hypothetical protein
MAKVRVPRGDIVARRLQDDVLHDDVTAAAATATAGRGSRSRRGRRRIVTDGRSKSAGLTDQNAEESR